MPDRLSRHYDDNGGLHHEDLDLLKKRTRAIIWDRLWRVFLGLGIIMLLVIMVYDVIIGSITRQQILSCTTPEGECYQQGQEETAEIVGDIRQAIILAVLCSTKEGVDTPRQVETCMVELLEADNNE